MAPLSRTLGFRLVAISLSQLAALVGVVASLGESVPLTPTRREPHQRQNEDCHQNSAHRRTLTTAAFFDVTCCGRPCWSPARLLSGRFWRRGSR